MSIFTPKHEMVEARQFTGGNENTFELNTWMSLREVKSLIATGFEDKPDRIMVGTSKYEFEVAFSGDWILIYKDGRVDVVRDGVFKERYSRVEEVYHAHV